MNLQNHHYGNLAVLIALFAVTGGYLWDTWRASTEIYNLIFVLPLTVSILVLCLATFVKELIAPDPVPDSTARQQDERERTSVFAVVILFVVYVVTLPWLGFDLGTFLFIAFFLRLAGEKNWPWTLGYSLVFSLGSALFFSFMLPYPMPLVLLPGVD